MQNEMEWNYDEVMAANPQFKQPDIDELKKWIQNTDSPPKNIPKDISNSLLLCFYNACELSVEDTKKCIKSYYSIREKAPEFFTDRDMTNSLMTEAADVNEFCIYPEKADNGCVILYYGLKNFQADKFHFYSSMKLFMMTIDKCLIENGPAPGLICTLDMTGVKMSHITRVNLLSISKLLSYTQEALPLKLRKIHIMNGSSLFEKFLTIMKPFIKKELLSLLEVHQPTENYETFHEKFLPKRCLPPKYGGTLPDTSIMHAGNVEKLTKLKPYFDEEEKQRYAYSKKSKKIETRSLNID